MLRQDPDVIMVGEIRDHETAEIAVNAATTGHLVFSTLHTIDASSSVARLIDLGVAPRQFADALSLVIAQRLIRLICQNCAEEYVPTAAEIAELELPAGREPATLKRGTGCTVCNGTGYYRRIGIFEFLQPSQRLRSAIENEKLSTGDIRNLAISGGMRTMRQEGIALLLKGGTTLEEVQRTTK
jgi:type II secretory ATPase GspE/PulE/Tfp pilus assembly ATPase PilB-like protein